MWSSSTATFLERSASLSETAHRLGADKANVPFPIWVYAVAGVLAFWACFSANPSLTPFAILTLLAATQLLWRKGEPPVLAFICGTQWLQASGIIFYTNFYGVSVAQVAGSTEFETATWMSLVAVLTLAAGIRLALLRCKRSRGGSLRSQAVQVSVPRAFILYIATFAIGLVARRVGFGVGSIAQALFALIYLKWAVAFILVYSIIEQRKGWTYLIAVVSVEGILGIISYFAEFKGIFFILLLVTLASPVAFRGKRLAVTFIVGVAFFVMSIVWSAVKGQYREFLNQGTGQQVVYVSAEESTAELTNLVQNLSWSSFVDGIDALILRVGYTNYFALTLGNVPANLPYENGALWLGAVKHVFTPRLFFPEKEALDDSARTALYTGLQVAGVEQGTSIGMGYVAESYVDFGPIGMFVPIALLGAFFGLIYRGFLMHPRWNFIGSGIASSIIMFNGYAIETSNIKIFGGTVTALLVVGGIYLIAAKPLYGWLGIPRA